MSVLKPLRGYVLIEPSDEDEVTASGIYKPESAKDKPSKGTVIGVGESILVDAVAPQGGLSQYPREWSPVKVGDIVVYQKWAGQDVKEGEKELRFVKFEDILGVYED